MLSSLLHGAFARINDLQDAEESAIAKTHPDPITILV